MELRHLGRMPCGNTAAELLYDGGGNDDGDLARLSESYAANPEWERVLPYMTDSEKSYAKVLADLASDIHYEDFAEAKAKIDRAVAAWARAEARADIAAARDDYEEWDDE